MNQPKPEKDHLSPADRRRVEELKALLSGTDEEKQLLSLFGLDTPADPTPPTEEKDK